MHHLWTGQDFGDRLPSDVFRDHFLTCFIADPIGIALRDEIGIDNICWEQDYPHSDSSWPNAPEEFARVAARYAVPDTDVNKITFENAMRWYRFDPFAHRTRSNAPSARSAPRLRVTTCRSTRWRRAGTRHAAKVSLAEMAARATA